MKRLTSIKDTEDFIRSKLRSPSNIRFIQNSVWIFMADIVGNVKAVVFMDNLCKHIKDINWKELKKTIEDNPKARYIFYLKDAAHFSYIDSRNYLNIRTYLKDS